MSQWINRCFDVLCGASILGIWPRFIEPRWLRTRSFIHKSSKIQGAPAHIVQLSDLHFHPKLTEKFIQKILNKVERLKPDIIVITGDFLIGSKMACQDHYDFFLSQISRIAPVYACLGNHDYNFPMTISSKGNYTRAEQTGKNPILTGLKLLLKAPIDLTGSRDSTLNKIAPHCQLTRMLDRYNIHLLHNDAVQVNINRSTFHLCGLADYMTPLFDPEKTFSTTDKSLFHLTLSHNPDSALILNESPSDLILSGHTHGGQINLPYIRRRISLQENPHLMRGLHTLSNSSLYINRGLCRYPDFRLFSPPEITSITLKGA